MYINKEIHSIEDFDKNMKHLHNIMKCIDKNIFKLSIKNTLREIRKGFTTDKPIKVAFWIIIILTLLSIFLFEELGLMVVMYAGLYALLGFTFLITYYSYRTKLLFGKKSVVYQELVEFLNVSSKFKDKELEEVMNLDLNNNGKESILSKVYKDAEELINSYLEAIISQKDFKRYTKEI